MPSTTRRLVGLAVSYAVTVFALVSLNFFLPRVLPGDPIEAVVARAGDTNRPLDEDTRAALTEYYGLDAPLVAQYGRYLARLAHGDLGTSIRHRAPVADIVVDRLGWTLLLVGTAFVVATGVGLVAGVHSGWRRGRSIDHGLLVVFLGLRNVPPFFLASLALFVFAVQLGWVPLSGAATPFGAPAGGLPRILDVAHHLVLPAGVLAVQYAATQYLVMRAGMVSELGADYLLLGRAKGLGDRVLKYRYAARNALLPVVSLTAVQLGVAVTGAIFVETIFAYPGTGRLMFEAVQARDYPLLQGCFLVLTVSVVALNALADALHARLDPRTAA